MIEIKNLRKEYHNPSSVPIHDLNLTIHDGDVVSLIGPSGTGKSTLLRMLNMLNRPTSGQIFVDGEDITAPAYPLELLRRKIGMVFQNFNLFPHMTVLENVCFAPIELKKEKPREVFTRAMNLLEEVGLAQYASAYPDILSGGQMQRVAIARALAMNPEVILFDEPTSSLDPTMVSEVQAVIKKLATENRTMILVTNDMSFAENVSNRIVFLADGAVYEEGTPDQIFHHPQREKTQAFVKRLSNLYIEIDNSHYDFLSIYSSIDIFALKYSLDGDILERLKAVIEELCFDIILPSLKETRSADARIKLELCYSATDKSALVNVEWEQIQFDSEDEKFRIQFALIRHYASDFRMEGNTASITIRR